MAYLIGAVIGAIVTFTIISLIFAARLAEERAALNGLLNGLRRAHADECRRLHLQRVELERTIKKFERER